jgi:nitrogen regulatory protein PII
MSFYDIKGRGRARQVPVSVGSGVKSYAPEFGFHTKIQAWVSSRSAKAIIDDVLKVMGKGSASVGKIFVYDVKEAYDLQTMERGESAL